MEDAMDVVMLVNQVQAAAKNVRDHKHMVAQLAGRIGALQSLIVSLVEDNGQACPPEFLERLQEELEAAVTSINRCTRSNGYRERYFEDITIDLKDVNFRIVNWLGDMRAHMVSAGMLEGRDQPHHQARALRILKDIRDSQERFEDFGSFADAEVKDSRPGDSADPSRKSLSGRRPSMDSRRARRSIGGGSRQGSLSMEYRSRPNSIERSRGNSFSSEDSRRDYRPRSLWTEAVYEEEAKIDELRRRARAELGEMNRENGSGRRNSDDYYRQKARDSREYVRRDSEDYYRERGMGRRDSAEMYQREKRGGRESLGDGHAILSPAEAVDFHDEVDRVLAALENTGDMDRVIQQIIETQTLGEREREFLIGKSERLKKERAAESKGPVFGDVGAGPWGGSDEDAEGRANRARPAEDTEQQLLKDVEEARKLAKEFRDGKKQYREVHEELLGSDLGYLPQTVKEEAAVAVVEITTALAVAQSAAGGSETGDQPWTYSPPRGGMDSIPEGSIGGQNPMTRRVSAALVAAGNDAPTRRLSSGGTRPPSIIPLDLPKSSARLKRTRSNEPTTLEDDIAAALKAQQEVVGQGPETQVVPAPGVIAIGQNGPVAIGAKGAGITGWPAGLLRTASVPPGPASRTNPEAVLKDKQREEASVMEKVYTALKAVKIGEKMEPDRLLEGDGKRTSFCELPTGPRVLRKDTKEVKKEIIGFMDEINAALEKARTGPPPGSENLSREPPAEFICPLSGALMRDPVLLIETEHNYERVYIERWFARGHRVCPASGVAVHTTTTLRNHKLRGEIRDWVKLEEISPRVELVQPRAEVPLSSTPRGTPDGVPRGTFEARGPPSSGGSSTISMNGRHDDIILDLAPDGSVEAAQAGDGARKNGAEQPVEPLTPAGIEGALPNGRGKESGIGREITEVGAEQKGEPVSGAEIVATGSVVEEIVAEEGKEEGSVTGATVEAESPKQEKGAEASKRLLSVTSRVKSAIEFFNSTAPVVSPQAS